jgi:DNA gyrase subunit B
VKIKKDTYYVQSEEEMKRQLLDKGLADSVLDLGDGRTISASKMTRLSEVLASMEEPLLALERRGVSLKTHATRLDAASGKLPEFHVVHGRQDYWIVDQKALDRFLSEKKLVADTGTVASAPSAAAEGAAGDAASPEQANRVHVTRLHEIQLINRGLEALKKDFGLAIDCLIPQDRTGLEGSRYALRRGESETGLDDLRLVAAVRRAAEKVLHVTRFKGRGEMNAEELRETTLDPANRTLVQVTLKDLSAADDMFRVLMGDKVEPRREFIEKHALEVRNLDV